MQSVLLGAIILSYKVVLKFCKTLTDKTLVSSERTLQNTESKMKAVDKWMRRLQDHKTPWTEQEIISFRKALGFCGLKDKDERGLLLAEWEHSDGYRITRQHDAKGQAYMLSKSLKADCKTKRKGCKLTDFDIRVLRELDYHLFIGLYSQKNGLGETLGYLPVYRAISIGGAWFEYIGTMYEQTQVLARSELKTHMKLRLVGGAK